MFEIKGLCCVWVDSIHKFNCIFKTKLCVCQRLRLLSLNLLTVSPTNLNVCMCVALEIIRHLSKCQSSMISMTLFTIFRHNFSVTLEPFTQWFIGPKISISDGELIKKKSSENQTKRIEVFWLAFENISNLSNLLQREKWTSFVLQKRLRLASGKFHFAVPHVGRFFVFLLI